MLHRILEVYGLKQSEFEIKQFGNGLINHTWKLSSNSGEYILQRINTAIFKEPQNIAHNIKLIGETFKNHFPDYLFVAPLATLSGNEMNFDNRDGYFRLFPFVSNSHTTDVVENPHQAFEAARQFGKFTKLLSNVDIKELKTTIPHFHNLSLRYQQFLSSIKSGNRQRIQQSQSIIQKLLGFADIVNLFEEIKQSSAFRLRVTHHDTKISNVLFDEENNGLCVIDLDTIMPGYFISDVGDMMRTYLPPVSEEECDYDKILIREKIYDAIVRGYYLEMKDELTEEEKRHFFYAGKFMIYMQALRFITDHLNDDIYYGARYEGHNFVRAKNQVVLLENLMKNEKTLVNDSWIMADIKPSHSFYTI
jgi:Ser/Thr protein kinase RdoA (MazF antagonist)